MKNRELLLVISVIAAVIIAVGFAAGSILMSDEHTTEKYQKALSAETSDICATPEGYTDEQWREHIGHHPDRYRECL